MQDTRTYAEQVSDDFWAWFGPKLDEHERVRASMPERDDASSTILGDEMLDIEFEPVAQAPTKALALEVNL